VEISWLIPASVETYVERERLRAIYDGILSKFLGDKYQLAVTGAAGAGKTVLMDYLAGDAHRADYKPPGTSQAIGHGRVPTKGKRIALSVIPGQDRRPRLEAMDEIFGSNRPVAGVIRVVSNGFITSRSSVSRQNLITRGVSTLKQYREHQRDLELEDLDQTLHEMRRSLRTHRKPAWLIVAVAKCDLYSDDLHDAKCYYSPEGEGQFVERLQKFLEQVGSDNFRWEACPVSAWLEHFEWNQETAGARILPPQRDLLLHQFRQLLGEYCER